MDINTLQSLLAGLPISGVRYFDTIGSTNDEALAWAASGCDDGCLVVADQQTQGRGRFRRRWVTHPGTALAFSVILHPSAQEMERLGLFSPLGAVAVSQALEDQLGLVPQIKWPNDVLLERKKVCGILVEAAWLGDQLQGMIIGIGLNVAPQAVPPAGELLFPATSVEDAAGQAVDRCQLLRGTLGRLFEWRSRLGEASFRKAWEDRLAFRGEWVRIEATSGEPVTGQVQGIDTAGNLLLQSQDGTIRSVAVGDVHLRPVD